MDWNLDSLDFIVLCLARVVNSQSTLNVICFLFWLIFRPAACHMSYDYVSLLMTHLSLIFQNLVSKHKPAQTLVIWLCSVRTRD